MKVSKKTALSMTSMSQNGGRGKTMDKPELQIKLKPVTGAERQRLRIPSYQYLLP